MSGLRLLVNKYGDKVDDISSHEIGELTREGGYNVGIAKRMCEFIVSRKNKDQTTH